MGIIDKKLAQSRNSKVQVVIELTAQEVAAKPPCAPSCGSPPPNTHACSVRLRKYLHFCVLHDLRTVHSLIGCGLLSGYD